MVTDSSFGRVLKTHRERIGMSRSQLAAAAGLSYPYVSQLETGLRKPSRKAAAQLAAALGLDPLDLEAAIPADDSDPSLQSRANLAQAALLEPLMGERPPSSFDARVAAIRSSARPSQRDELIGQLVDLLEEFPAEERLDVLAELQKRAMQSMLDERSP